ncbi:helicase [Microbacterium caowuchunii]|uniref:helicase n=1 Tax=Microbacterium caowuchunii TaxID=2614638 RepID=UPI00124481DF|nr:helicase [Microbacterium caowuchunii]QEV99325.1 helicase [Microbacterium caowuchunii]
MPGAATSAGMLAVLATVTVGLAAVGAGAVHAQRLSAAVDAAALAAADAASGAISGVPCDRAGRIAAEGAFDVVSCEVEGITATVRISGSFGPFPAMAVARAGPPPGQTIVVGR